MRQLLDAATCMPFPTSERISYRANTLAEVVCQLRFPQVLAISSDPVAFQEIVRGQFPLYSVEDPTPGMPAEFAELLAGHMPTQTLQRTHRFADADEKARVGLSANFVAFSTNQYSRWETFAESLEHARDALERVYHPAFYERVGLRYRNVIDRAALGLDGVPWSALINSAVLGPVGDDALVGDVRQTSSRAVFDVGLEIGARALLQWGLADVQPGGGEPLAPARSAYFLDCDYSTEERTASDAIADTLSRLHRLSGDVFQWAILPRLAEALGPDVAD